MADYVLRREQLIPQPIEAVFAFFADAKNLQAMTPPSVGFTILTPGPIAMRAGARIEYRIRIHMIPMHWITEIRTWDPPLSFTDVQLRGPYRRWEHTHSFQAVDGGTLMRDEVHYALPLGIIGRIAHACFVNADLKGVFDYRAKHVSALVANARGRA